MPCRRSAVSYSRRALCEQVFDGSVARTSGNPWRTVFGYCISPQRPRDTRRSMLSMELDAVRPDSLQQPLVTELRLRFLPPQAW